MTIDTHTTPKPRDLARASELAAALSGLLEQVYQMQGLFDDEDGAIAVAVADAEFALGDGV